MVSAIALAVVLQGTLPGSALHSLSASAPVLVSAQRIRRVTTPKVGLVITRSTRIKAGEYILPSPGSTKGTDDFSKPAIEIRGNNLTVDFKGAVIRGSKADVDPDKRPGLGIKITGKNVRIRNLKIHGYKVALWVDKASNFKLEDSDLSYNWKQHLKSTLEKEDLSDWMSYHKNEKDEWLRYGAAAYLKDVDRFEITGCRVTGGQNALMLMRANRGKIWNNQIDYMSSLGLGMYRSSENQIMHNNIDWCVRGYSHGVYNRGQDSSGILIYEQSNKNVFAYNSVTHGGDGFFLWAGQTTMDTGKGGCNDNLVYGNDFSHAPTNGIEATFSRNKFVNNLLRECWHGFWTGYSFNTLIQGNFIEDCEDGIAHEHGQDNRVEGNFFAGNKNAINIWANEKQDPNWGYPKTRDTVSRDWKIVDNTIMGGTALRVRRTSRVSMQNNTLHQAGFAVEDTTKTLFVTRNTLYGDPTKFPLPTQAETADNQLVPSLASTIVPTWNPFSKKYADAPRPMNGGKNPFFNLSNTDVLRPRGRKTIIVDEWGPYDYRSPKIWPAPSAMIAPASGPRKFSIYGPKGSWRLVEAKGVEVSSVAGTVPGSIEITPAKGLDGNRSVVLEYIGKETVDHRGIVTPAGKPVKFEWSTYELPMQFEGFFFRWNKDSSDPRTQFEEYLKARTSAKITAFQVDKLDYAGYGKFALNVPATHFGTSAVGTFKVPAWKYRLEVTADDGIRVAMDGKRVIDAWKYQGPTVYTYEFTEPAGAAPKEHKLEIEHFQIDGYATLKVKVVPIK